MPTEAHVVIALVGFLVGLASVPAGRRGAPQWLVAVLFFGGFGAFAGAGLNAMDSAHLSGHARGLWITGIATLLAASSSLAIRDPKYRSSRTFVVFLAIVFAVLFLAELVWRVDLIGAVLGDDWS